MADETRNGGTPKSGRAPATEAELRAEERTIIAFFHADAARCAEALRNRTEKVGGIVGAFGHEDSRVRALRRDLRDFTRLTCRLLDFQFTDLEP